MGNMGYCRFQNTVADLQDCYDYLWEKLSSDEEERARKQLIKLCKNIVYDVEGED